MKKTNNEEEKGEQTKTFLFQVDETRLKCPVLLSTFQKATVDDV